MDVDAGVDSIFEEEEVEDVDSELEQLLKKYRFITPQVIARMSASEKAVFFKSGLD